MSAGVYRITCKSNSHYYFGSSIKIESRFKNHILKLKTQNHRNHRLQRIYNKYGIDSLIFEVVEYCSPEETLIVEQKFLDKYAHDENCINFCKDAKAPMKGLKFSEHHKRKMSESQIRNQYIFTFSNGDIKKFKSLSEMGRFFNVRNAIASKWFKRKNLGRKNGLLFKNNIVKAEKNGDENICLLPFEYKEESWIVAGAASRSEYYRERRKKLLAA